MLHPHHLIILLNKMIAPLAKPVIMFMCFHLLDPFLNQKLSNNKPDKRLQNAINESGHDIEWLFPWGVRIVRFSCLFCLIRDWPTAQTTRKMSTLYVHVVKWQHVSCTSWGGPPCQVAHDGCKKWMCFLRAHREKTAFSVMKRCAPLVALSCIRYVVHSSSLPFS